MNTEQDYYTILEGEVMKIRYVGEQEVDDGTIDGTNKPVFDFEDNQGLKTEIFVDEDELFDNFASVTTEKKLRRVVSMLRREKIERLNRDYRERVRQGGLLNRKRDRGTNYPLIGLLGSVIIMFIVAIIAVL